MFLFFSPLTIVHSFWSRYSVSPFVGLLFFFFIFTCSCVIIFPSLFSFFFFFLNEPAPPEFSPFPLPAPFPIKDRPRRDRGGAVPRGPVLSTQRRADRNPAAAGASRRYPAARRALRGPVHRAERAGAQGVREGGGEASHGLRLAGEPTRRAARGPA